MTTETDIRDALSTLLRSFASGSGFVADDHTCQRIRSAKIDVVRIEFLPETDAIDRGLSPISFLIRGGCYFPAIKPFGTWETGKHADGSLAPAPDDCPLIIEAIKPTASRLIPVGTPAHRYGPTPNIWSVERATRVDDLLVDARERLALIGRFMEEKMRTPGDLLQHILAHEEDMSGDVMVIHGYGRKGSPKYLYTVGSVAFAIGQWALALESFVSLIEASERGALRRLPPESEHAARIRELIAICRSRLAS